MKTILRSLKALFAAAMFTAPCGTVRAAWQQSIFAGPSGTQGSVDGSCTTARFNQPQDAAVDADGNVYVADSNSNTIRKITPVGVVSTLAGSPGLSGSADGTGGAARFWFPAGIAVDAGGSVYVADTGNCTIRKITSAGVVSTLAGSAGQYGSADDIGSNARFYGPYSVAVDASGNVYVADIINCTIRKVTPVGVVTTLAGSSGQSGNTDATGSSARFNQPQGVAVDLNGNVYVADNGNKTIRKVSAAGTVTTLAGSPTGQSGYADGTGKVALFGSPNKLAVDSGGNVYVTDGGVIRKVTPEGMVTTLAGQADAFELNLDGTGTGARFAAPKGITMDSGGNLYVSDIDDNTIRKVTQAGVVTTYAGSPVNYGSSDGSGSAAQFTQPGGVALDASGNVYLADSYNNTIRKITPDGEVSTLAGTAGNTGNANGTGGMASFNWPTGVVVDSAGNVYLADQYNNLIRKVTPAGVVSTFAGSGEQGSADDTGTAASFNSPRGLAADSGGNLYVADNGNNTIRKITSAGVVSTLAGNSGNSGSADGTGAEAGFNGPWGVAVDAGGNVYVADSRNNTIRKVTATGVVTTLAGNGMPLDSDGTGSAAGFSQPCGIAVDDSGNVYVGEGGYGGGGSGHIRKVTPEGVVTTLADSSGVPLSLDPIALAINAVGSAIYVANDFNNNVALVTRTCVSGVPTVTTPTYTGVADTTATLGGNVTADGGAAVAELGVAFAPTATNGNPQIGGTGVTNVPGTGTVGVFTVDVSGLSPGTNYTFAAYATNSAGTGYSSTGSFTTPAARGGTWRSMAPMLAALGGAPAVGTVNGLLYVCGGCDSGAYIPYLNTVEAYDPATNAWSVKAAMPTGRRSFCACAANGILYAIGGWRRGGYDDVTNAVEAYDPASNAWTSESPMPTARACFGTCAVNGIIYAIGGIHSHNQFDNVEAYDPVANSWAVKPPMPTARRDLGVVAVNGLIYALGGSAEGQ